MGLSAERSGEYAIENAALLRWRVVMSEVDNFINSAMPDAG